VTDFISQAVVLSLKEFPDVNSSTGWKDDPLAQPGTLGSGGVAGAGAGVPVIRQSG